MASEKRLIDVSDAEKSLRALRKGFRRVEEKCAVGACILEIKNVPTIDAVDAKRYEALIEMYHDLRENFIDYVCSGIPNVAPYCLNKCEDCVTAHGWCKFASDKCRGFNPAEVILDGERKDNE